MPPPPRTPRTPLCEVSPNSRSRVVSAREYGARWCTISEKENLSHSTCRSIFKYTSEQASCKSRPCNGRSPVITPRDGRALFRAIANNPKITAAKLRVEVIPRYLKNQACRSGDARRDPFWTTRELLHTFTRLLYMITSLLLIGDASFGLTSVLVSVEKEANRTLYTESRVSKKDYL